MSGNQPKTNKTLTELATEYMQEYYCTFSSLGENHPTTKFNFACWQAIKGVAANPNQQKALTVVPPPLPEEVRKTLFRSLLDWAKSILHKFNKK